MESTELPQRLSWTGTELYRELSATFPTYRTRQQNVLDVEKLSQDLGMTKEGLYKWFRAKRILSSKGLEKVVELANTPDNIDALNKVGRQPPTKADYARFMLS